MVTRGRLVNREVAAGWMDFNIGIQRAELVFVGPVHHSPNFVERQLKVAQRLLIQAGNQQFLAKQQGGRLIQRKTDRW